MTDVYALEEQIDAAWEVRDTLDADTKGSVRQAVKQTLKLLDRGKLRIAEKVDDQWVTHQWRKKAVLLSFRLMENKVGRGGVADVRGTAVTCRGKRDTGLMRVDEREDGRGNPYFWVAFAKGKHTPLPGSDLHALAEKKISVTPLRLDLTDEATRAAFAEAFA